MILLTFSACEKKAEEPAVVANDGSQTAAGLAGNGQKCETFSGVGSNLTGKGYTRFLRLEASGAYYYAIYFSDNTGCATSQTAGGNNIATYSQTGTFSVGGTAGTPATATKITFTAVSSTIVARPKNPDNVTNNSVAGDLITWLNSCTPTPGFSTTATSTKSVANLVCTNPSHSLPGFPSDGSSYTNIGYNPGDGSFSAGSRDNIWSPGTLGTSTFPGTYTETWGTWTAN